MRLTPIYLCLLLLGVAVFPPTAQGGEYHEQVTQNLADRLGQGVKLLVPNTLPVVRMAILPTTGDPLDLMRPKLEQSMLASGRYRILERTEIDKIYGEERFQLGSDIDPSTIANLAGKNGAEAVLISRFTSSAGFFRHYYTIHVKLVQVSTLDVLWSQEFTCSNFAFEAVLMIFVLATFLLTGWYTYWGDKP